MSPDLAGLWTQGSPDLAVPIVGQLFADLFALNEEDTHGLARRIGAFRSGE